jgi:hypothetical protein
VEKETHLAEERDREGGGGDDLCEEEEEHGEGEQDGDGEGDLLPRVRRQVEHQHCQGIAHPVSPITMMPKTVLFVQQFDGFRIKLFENTRYRTRFFKGEGTSFHERGLYFMSRQNGSKFGTHIFINANETASGTKKIQNLKGMPHG